MAVPKTNTAYAFLASLPDMADTRLFKDNPTLAAGDVKVVVDTTNLGNITSLPTAVTGNTRVLAFALTAAEMNGDHIAVICHDAAGAEWADVIFEIDTTAATEDDLATAITAVDDYVDTEVAAIKAKTDNLPADPADASDIAASLATITGYIDTEVAAILAAVDTEVAAIKAKTDSLTFTTANQLDVQVLSMAANVLTASALATNAVTEITDAILALVPTEAAGAPSTLGQLIYHIRQLGKNKLVYNKATDHMILYKDDGTTALYDHTMVDDASTATRGAGA